jgi:hypothetical protein
MVFCGGGDPREVRSTMGFPAPNPADEYPTGLFGEIGNDGAELNPAEEPTTFLTVVQLVCAE